MGLLDLIVFGIPVFRRKLFISEKLYLLSKKQNKGELDLTEIAAEAKREDHWTFFDKNDIWLHPGVNHSEEFDPLTGAVKMNVSFNPLDLNNEPVKDFLGSVATEYHIHADLVYYYYLQCNPENNIGFHDYFKSVLIYPSNCDLKNTLVYPERTYKIASSLGITTYQLNSPDLFKTTNIEEIESLCQPDFLFSAKPLDEWLMEYVDNVKTELGNYATLDFCPKSKL